MDEIEHRLERIEGAVASLARSVDARFDAIERRLDTLSDRLGRQVAVTESLRSDVRVFGGIAQAMLVAVQTLAGAYTDLENRAGS